MIEIKLMYELYVKELNHKLKELLQNKVDLVEGHTSLQNILKNYKDIFPIYMGAKFEDVLTYTEEAQIKNLHYPSSPIYKHGKEIPFKAIKLYLQKYIVINKKLRTIDSKINTVKGTILPFDIYKKIIVSFNKKISTKIVEENYLFTGIPSFGALGVIRNYNEHKRVNWGESNKNKKAIIAKGGIPYIKEDAENIPNYQGEEWLVYHPFLDFYLHWFTKHHQHKFNPVLKDYKYKPARGKKSIVSALQMVKNNPEKADNLYTRTLKNERTKINI